MNEKYAAQLRGLVYIFVAISTGIVFGRTSEICDITDDCPGRAVTIIVFSVLSFVISIPLILATALDKVPASAEASLSVLLVVFCTVTVGVSTSVHTLSKLPRIINLPLGFSWVAQLLAVIAWYVVTFEVVAGGKSVVVEEKPAETAQAAVETVAPDQVV